MRKIYIKLVLLLMTALLLLPFLYLNNIETAEVTHIKNTAYQPSFEVKGVIESSEIYPIKLSYPVYIKKSYVSEDSYVNKGQLIFELDTDKMEEAVKNYSFAVDDADNFSVEKDMILNISKEIYAADSGCIRNLAAFDGSLVLSDEELCVIESNNTNMLKVFLNQEDYSRVAIGDTIQFSTDIMPEKLYTATINSKTAHIRKENSLTGKKTIVEIYADIDNADDFILSGLEITGTLVKPARQMSVLPYEYVNQDENGEFLTVFSNGNYIKEYVKTGTETPDSVEILDKYDADTLFIKKLNENKGISLLVYED